MASDIDWIAVDWGTSALRAWAMDADGNTLAEAKSDKGMGKLTPDEFEPTLLDLIGSWLPDKSAGSVQIVACGMVGARQGWVEAAYRSTPCSPVGAPFKSVPTSDSRIKVQIVPGLSQQLPADVMRGEETQIAGLLRSQPDFAGMVCLPGTHTKWAMVSDGQIVEFTTFMTGELFDLLSNQSILRHSVQSSDQDNQAFESAVAEAMKRPQSVAGALFGIRAGSLLSDQNPHSARSRLSGYLVGMEIAAIKDRLDGQPVAIIGNSAMATAYKSALALLNIKPDILDASQMTLSGLTAAHNETSLGQS